MLVLVRPPGPAFRDAISNHPDAGQIDVDRAQLEHAAFCHALEAVGIPLLRLPEEPGLPDATFVSDTLIALPSLIPDRAPIVVVARPALPARRAEVQSVLRAAMPHLPPDARLLAVEEPGTLEGGDVVIYGDRLAIGVSGRTDDPGARVLAEAARSVGYRPFLCPVSDRLHLATAVTAVTPDTLIGTAAGFASLDAGRSEAGGLDGPGSGAAGHAALPDTFHRLVLPDEEFLGANVLAIAGHAFLDSRSPVAARLLGEVGLTVHLLELEQFALADGGPTCLVNILP